MAEFLRTKLKPLDKATQSPTSEFPNIKKNNSNRKNSREVDERRAFSKAMLGQPLPKEATKLQTLRIYVPNYPLTLNSNHLWPLQNCFLF